MYVSPVPELDKNKGNSLVPASQLDSPKSSEDLLLGNIYVLNDI